MFKKCVIFLFLATAYTVLLAHNFTPHQHHTEQTTHHHGHDHNHDDHEGGNEESSFHYFHHTGESGIEFTYGQFIKYDVQKKAFETTFIKLAGIVLSHFEKPPLILPLARKEQLSIPQTLPYFFPLKAPPACAA